MLYYVRGEQLDKLCFSASHLIRYWKMCYIKCTRNAYVSYCIFWEIKHLNIWGIRPKMQAVWRGFEWQNPVNTISANDLAPNRTPTSITMMTQPWLQGHMDIFTHITYRVPDMLVSNQLHVFSIWEWSGSQWPVGFFDAGWFAFSGQTGDRMPWREVG